MLPEQRKGVLITGGTGGLGGAVIRAFVEAGYPVATTYTNPEGWESLGDLREEVLGLEVDLLDARAAEEAARRAAEGAKTRIIVVGRVRTSITFL